MHVTTISNEEVDCAGDDGRKEEVICRYEAVENAISCMHTGTVTGTRIVCASNVPTTKYRFMQQHIVDFKLSRRAKCLVEINMYNT